jgi:glycosyltransferase involved in cell wall biosynthesis
MSDDAPILLDVTRLIWRRWKGRYPTGIDRVCLAYLRHFGAEAQAVVQHDRFRRILGRDASRELFDLLDGPKNIRSTLPLGVLRHLSDLRGMGRGRPYLNVGHTGLDSAGFRDWVSSSEVKPIYLVHDLIPITHPHFCRAREDQRHRERMRTVLTTGSGIIGNSQVTLDELAHFADGESLPMPPSVVAWLGSEPLSLPPSEPERRPTFVVLGTIEARKNHLMLLNIWLRLIDRLGDDAPRLLIVGQRGWKAEAVFDRLDRNEKLRGHVVELNHCSDDELARHIANATALLFPSLEEGYGLPLIEALGAGVPVIAGDLPVFREIVGQIPTYLGSSDDAAWEAAILDYAQSDSAARAAQLDRMKTFVPPSWRTHFGVIEAWLRKLGLTAEAL